MIKSPILELEINPEMISEGFTTSEIQTWDNCSEKWYLGYNLMLHRPGNFSWALQYGTWMHAALEEFYASKGKRWHFDPVMDGKTRQFLHQDTLADFEYWAKLGKLQMQMYASMYKNDFKLFKVEHTETVADIDFEGIRLKGKLDVYLWSDPHKGYYVMDHKTASRFDPNTILGWDFRLQFMIYCWFAWKLWPNTPVHGYFVNSIKKPALKRKMNESVDSFLQRVQVDMQERPEEYFYRERLRLKKADLVHFEETILRPKLLRIRTILNPDVPLQIKAAMMRNKNTDMCYHYNKSCEFLPACQHGLSVEQHQYKKRAVKHVELTELE